MAKMADPEAALLAALTLDEEKSSEEEALDGELPEPLQAGLERLPNELVLKVLEHVDSAKDVAALMATSTRFGPVVDGAGWPGFVRSRFGSLTIPGEPAGPEWKALAESLTWQSRCWDRRSLRFAATYPSEFTGRRGGRSLPFRTIIDARFDLGSRRELLVWGAGQDIVARYRDSGPAGQPSTTPGSSWNQIKGESFGFAAGHGDVQAINIINLPKGGGSAVLAGRANGDLSLYSAAQDDSFGTRRANFSPTHIEDPKQRFEAENWQKTIESVDVYDEKGEGLVAVTTNNGPILVYRLPHSHDGHNTNISPSDSFNLLDTLLPPPSNDYQPSVLNAKWMGRNDMAVALRGPKEPLMYLTMTPTGWVATSSAKNKDIEVQFGPQTMPIFPNSLQPVTPHSDIPWDTKLLLSSWRDGTVRLMDIRTPSAHDMIYQDNIQPSDSIGTLLTYGTERFIGGSLDGAKVKIFDFRWTREYYHTDGLPCATYDPFPAAYQPFVSKSHSKIPEPDCCNHQRGLRCRWHKGSRDLYHRPNAMFMFSEDIPHRLRSNLSVTSMAKGSDISPNFYVGISGGVIEATLSSSDTNETDPNLGFADWSRGESTQTGYKTIDLRTSMMEIGDGRSSRHNGQNIRLPYVYKDEDSDLAALSGISSVLRRQHRLDSRFQFPEDFPSIPDQDGRGNA